MLLIKTIAAFILIILSEMVNGTLRVRYLVKRYGKPKALVISFILGSVMVIVWSFVTVPLIAPESLGEAWIIGAVWASMMTAADIYIGRRFFKLSYPAIMRDFDPRSGNLLTFGIILLLCMPAIVWMTSGS